MDFVKSEGDSNLYYIMIGGEPLILLLYVDDLFLIGSQRLIADCKRDLASEFDYEGFGVDALFSWIGSVVARFHRDKGNT
jgi:hypothetical protein